METKTIWRSAEWVGIQLNQPMLDQLAAFHDWIQTEATNAGGIGPDENSDLAVRHIADSVLFAVGWQGERPDRVLDIGAGVGLPTIPLAVTNPESTFLGLDRSGRRIRLLKRAVRVLGLENVIPIHAELGSVDEQFRFVVSRAAIPPLRLRPQLERLLRPGGTGVVGGSHVARPEVAGYKTLDIPTEVLDRPAWILMMARS